MGGRRAAWLVALPLVAAGWLTAHGLAYVLVAPDPHHREEVLAETGHGYLAAAPSVLAFALTVLACGLGLAVCDGARGAAGRPVPLWPVALVAPLGFAAQEHVERLLALGAFPGAALEPSFLVGIALQLPFALAALLVARAVIRVGEALGQRLRVTRPRAVHGAIGLCRPRSAPALARLPVLATGHAERAPPRPAGTT
jgi:hypothetical protein